jgi:hypothetical protein
VRSSLEGAVVTLARIQTDARSARSDGSTKKRKRLASGRGSHRGV